jgi:hypothetical protein
MFLGRYRFAGDPDELLPAYDRLMTSIPPAGIYFHACISDAAGITIYDACPTPEVFAAFSTSDDFAGACAAAGLPSPDVEPLGDMHAAYTHGSPVAFD